MSLYLFITQMQAHVKCYTPTESGAFIAGCGL